MKKHDLVAPCGDYCSGCGQYNGLIIKIAKLMKDLADLYGFEFRSKGVFDFKEFVKGLKWFINNAKCPGCQQGGGPPWCEVKKCCFEKGLRICFECVEFPCSKFKEYSDPDTMDRYERFKEIGFEKWVDEQMQKAKEGYEIHLQKVVSLQVCFKNHNNTVKN
ncbi:MAG: DUF3795 domain-containing protein [Candidatus Heimdallarchaeota archaeon]|nr:DUF3795 domain-containing protein [Candidatus Heimdallarchaeota archaeon]MCG3256024.1 DUF3795 domain-containing protein [Candidatus Heimdallarchaeota archaeon]MCK4611094.1 DUF3795 domain-containing protein [Candidatus Heimdallarchaeota archaeon]